MDAPGVGLRKRQLVFFSPQWITCWHLEFSDWELVGDAISIVAEEKG